MRKTTRTRKYSRNFLVTSLAMGAVLAVSRPAYQAKVFATADEYEWTKHEENDLLGGEYTSAASSADGSKLILSATDGGEGYNLGSPLYLSGDYGATWQNITEDVETRIRNNWSSADMSNDGQKLVASSYNSVDLDSMIGGDGKVFISQDSGDSWINVTPSGTTNWQHTAISGDGSKIVALSGDDVGNIYTSDDSGDTWDMHPVSSNWNWESVSISDDGNKILVGGESTIDASSFVFLSEDGGDNWTNISPDMGDMVFLTRTAMTATGDKMVVSSVAYDGDTYDAIYMSDDSGDNWTNITPDDTDVNDWYAVAISDDGAVLSALDRNDKMFISRDNGANWTEVDPGAAGDDANQWNDLDFNATGSRIITASDANAYSGYNASIDAEPEPETEVEVELTDAEGGKAITLTLPAGVTVTCHAPVKESGLTAQDGAYSYPLGLVDFCFSGADATNDITLIFVADLKPNEVAVRKYNPASGQYATISNATITETTAGGKHALRVTYTVADNGPLDTDPDAGEVADPVGLAVLAATSPDTGFEHQSTQMAGAALLTGTALLAGTAYAPIRRKVFGKAGSKK